MPTSVLLHVGQLCKGALDSEVEFIYLTMTTTPTSQGANAPVKQEMSWPIVLFHIHVNIFGFYGLVKLLDASLLTILFSLLLVALGVLGVNAGAHRLWAHRSYEANTSLRIFLMLCHTLTGQGTIHDWAVQHRLHHKHFGTDEDPYNHNKGFWHSHVTPHLLNNSKTYKQSLALVDSQDLENDAVVAFQKKFYWLLMPIICILLPVNAPMEYWGDNIINAICITGFLRYAISTHLSWFITSAIHIWGLKPGEKYPSDTMYVFILTKSHWPKYHYILPWDYKVSEYGSYDVGFSSSFIRTFAAFGWASNLRSVSSEIIKEAVYASTTSGRGVNECIEDITKTKVTAYQTSKFL